jgi:hypothetical protein
MAQRPKIWWRRPLLALTRYALAQGGRANAGTGTVFVQLSLLYRKWLDDERARDRHGFVKPPIARLPAFRIDDRSVVVRSPAGRIKAVESASMRSYVAAARRKVRATLTATSGIPRGRTSRPS